MDCVGEVIDIRSRKSGDELLLVIRDALVAKGSISRDIDSLTVSVELWRKAARGAGRSLKRPVRTVITDRVVHAVLADWPRDDHERRIQQAALRAAMNAASQYS